MKNKEQRINAINDLIEEQLKIVYSRDVGIIILKDMNLEKILATVSDGLDINTMQPKVKNILVKDRLQEMEENNIIDKERLLLLEKLKDSINQTQ